MSSALGGAMHVMVHKIFEINMARLHDQPASAARDAHLEDQARYLLMYTAYRVPAVAYDEGKLGEIRGEMKGKLLFLGCSCLFLVFFGHFCVNIFGCFWSFCDPFCHFSPIFFPFYLFTLLTLPQ